MTGLLLGSAVDVFQSIFFGLREDGFQGFFGVSTVAYMVEELLDFLIGIGCVGAEGSNVKYLAVLLDEMSVEECIGKGFVSFPKLLF